MARDLHNIQINDNYKTISLDIKDLYISLQVQNILNITKFWLKANNQNQAIIDDILHLLVVILGQNYFQTVATFTSQKKELLWGPLYLAR